MTAAAVLYVADLERMCSFYRECFALQATDTAADHCVLESETWTLSLVVVPDSVAATLDLSVPPARRTTVPIKLAFPVSSIRDLRPVVLDFGGQVDPSSAEWEYRGFRHCDGVDPEGNVIELREPLTAERDAVRNG